MHMHYVHAFPQKDEVITLIGHDDADDWWTGRIGEREGSFPRTYVQRIDNPAPQATTPVASSSSSSAGAGAADNWAAFNNAASHGGGGGAAMATIDADEFLSGGSSSSSGGNSSSSSATPAAAPTAGSGGGGGDFHFLKKCKGLFKFDGTREQFSCRSAVRWCEFLVWTAR